MTQLFRLVSPSMWFGETDWTKKMVIFCEGCGADCYRSDDTTTDQPCWGQVDAIAEEKFGEDDWVWVHACQGHIDQYDGSGPYLSMLTVARNERRF